MSDFPRAARLFVVLTMACAGAVVPSAAVADDHPRSAQVSRHHGDKLTKKQIRQRARAKARAEAARVRAAQLHARAVARKNLRLRNNTRIPHRAVIVFNKNWDNPFDSRIIFRSWAKTGPKGRRSGSGSNRLRGAQARDCLARPVGTHATAARVGRPTAPTRSSSTTGVGHLSSTVGSSSCSRRPAATAPCGS